MGLRAKRSRTGNLTLIIPMVPEDKAPAAKSKGLMSGLGIWEFVAILLDSNELVTCNLKMTDEMMQQKIMDEFPNSKRVQNMKAGKVKMTQWRSEYNTGRLTGSVPRVKSKRYTRRGYVMDGHTHIPIAKGRSEVPADQRNLKLRQQNKPDTDQRVEEQEFNHG